MVPGHEDVLPPDGVVVFIKCYQVPSDGFQVKVISVDMLMPVGLLKTGLFYI